MKRTSTEGEKKMFIYKYVLAHWVVFSIVFSLVYLVVMGRTAFRFANMLYVTSWYRKIHWFKLCRIGGYRIFLFRYPLRLVCIVLGYLFAIPLFVLFQILDYRERKKAKEDRKKAAEDAERRRERLRQAEEENQRRASKRRQWLSNNKPLLYYNTVSGITAVLREADYERVRRETENARLDEFWDAINVMKPDYETLTFVTKTGRELVAKNDEHASRYKIAGWISELYQFCQKNGCELIRDETIFVPWVNETLVSFTEQNGIFRDCHGLALITELVDKQVPSEYRPISVC